ncbi:MAG TPA: hypothetical protein QF753_20595 [Victivallales bacterium]|nr:hypothetical protein [Victivallales bacterium]
MRDISDKLSNLENSVLGQYKKFRKSLKVTIIIYIIIIILVLAYTIFIYTSIKDNATPDAVAELVTMQLEKELPKVNDYLKGNSQELADTLAINTVDYLHILIPQLGIITKDHLNAFTKQAVQHIEKTAMPEIVEYLNLHSDIILKNSDAVTDKEIANRLVMMMTERLNTVIDQTFSQDFYSKLNELQTNINRLANLPDSKLTRQELAEKQALISWIYICQYTQNNNIATD